MQTDLSLYREPEKQVTSTDWMPDINLDLTCIDLFAGCGGFSLGMAHAGYNMIAAVEISDMCCDTLRHNKPKAFPNMKIINEDITKLSTNRLLKTAGVKKGKLQLLIGGPPCQGFSFNNTKRSLDDPRSKLILEYLRILKGVKPKIFLIENVPGLLTFRDFFIAYLGMLEDSGYVVRFLMMDCASYGVPQTRRRVIIEGVRNDLKKIPAFPSPSHFDNSALKLEDDEVFTPAEVACKCFKINGFTKEEAKNVWWNTKLNIMMNKKTASDEVDEAINLLIGEKIVFMSNPNTELREPDRVLEEQTARGMLRKEMEI